LLTDQLISLCNFNSPQNKNKIYIDSEFRTIRRLCPLPVVLPLERTLVPIYPNDCRDLQKDQCSDSNAPTIEGKKN
jgi:hypothetical protein